MRRRRNGPQDMRSREAARLGGIRAVTRPHDIKRTGPWIGPCDPVTYLQRSVGLEQTSPSAVAALHCCCRCCCGGVCDERAGEGSPCAAKGDPFVRCAEAAVLSTAVARIDARAPTVADLLEVGAFDELASGSSFFFFFGRESSTLSHCAAPPLCATHAYSRSKNFQHCESWA